MAFLWFRLEDGFKCGDTLLIAIETCRKHVPTL